MTTYYIDRPNAPQVATIEFKRLMQVEHDPDLSYLTQDYAEESELDRAKYKAQDKERLDAYERGEWHMRKVYVEAQISMPIGGNSFACYSIQSPGLCGVASDSGHEYFTEVWDDEEEGLKDALKAIGPVLTTKEHTDNQT